MNKILYSGLVLGAIISISGCGGGNSNTDDSESVPVHLPPPTGTAYYIDSAVSGINYKCGQQEGITGTDGSFTFQVGQSCTFYLGDMELRDVHTGLLVDGTNIYETDVKIARILQSLDTDGNPDNGITIDATTVAALSDNDITALPTSEAEMDEMLAVIAANGGTEVSEDDAAAHMLTTLFVGQTYYAVACDTVDGQPNDHVETLVFEENGALTLTWMENGQQIIRNFTYSIDGDVLSIVTSDETIAFTGVVQGLDYVLFSTGGKFYTSATAATDALANSCNSSSETTPESPGDYIIITEAKLSGKTFYFSNEEEQGTDYKSWSFSNGTLTIDKVEWEDLTTRTTDTANYSIEDGKILMEDKPGEFMHIVLKNETDTSWKIRAQSTTDASNGIDMVLYLSKPAYYPAAL